MSQPCLFAKAVVLSKILKGQLKLAAADLLGKMRGYRKPEVPLPQYTAVLRHAYFPKQSERRNLNEKIYHSCNLILRSLKDWDPVNVADDL